MRCFMVVAAIIIIIPELFQSALECGKQRGGGDNNNNDNNNADDSREIRRAAE